MMDGQYYQDQPSQPKSPTRFLLKLPIIKQIYNLITTGHMFPDGLGHGTALILTLLVLFAIGLALTPIFFSAGGIQGIASGIQNLVTDAGEVADSALGGYTETVQQAMGVSYASEIDRNARRDIGLFIGNLESSRPTHYTSDPITVWGDISGNAPGSNRNMEVDLSCNYFPPGFDSDSTEGFITPTDKYVFDREMSRNFRCEFPAGTIDRDSAGAHNVEVNANFNFETMAYFTIPFMDEEAFLALRQSDPQRINNIQSRFIAQNTYSPLEIGIGTQEFPILVSQRADSHATIGFSINDRWGGHVNELTSFNILIPNGIILDDCDNPIDFVESPSQYDDFFINYSLVDEGIEHLSRRLRTNHFSERFEPQSFQCFLAFQPSIIFAERSRLDPIELNIFPHIEFEYSLRERVNINVRETMRVFHPSVTPATLSLTSIPTIRVTNPRGNINSATIELRHRKSDELSSTVVAGYDSLNMIRASDGSLTYSFSQSLESISNDIDRGDTIIFRIDVLMQDGNTDFDLISRTLGNNPPELYDGELYFDQVENNQLTCYAKAIDQDGDDIESSSFFFNNRNKNEQVTRQGACEKQSEYWLCSATIDVSNYDASDVIECSVTLSDGYDYNSIDKRIESELSSLMDMSDDDPVDDEPVCVSDGQNAWIRGSSTGFIDVNGEPRYREGLMDECLDDNILLDYYCDESTNRIVYLERSCRDGCFDGVCLR